MDAWPDGGRGGGARPAEPTVLVESDSADLVRLASLALLEEQYQPGDGLVVVASNETDEGVLDRTTASLSDLTRQRIGMVDRRGRGPGEAPGAGPVGTIPRDSGPAAMTDAVRRCFEFVDAGAPGRVHLFVDGVVGEFTDAVYDRLYELAMGVGTEPGLAVFGLDRTAVDERSRDQLPHLFDVHVSLRERGGEPEARWTALTGGSDGWESVNDLSLGVPAFA